MMARDCRVELTPPLLFCCSPETLYHISVMEGKEEDVNRYVPSNRLRLQGTTTSAAVRAVRVVLMAFLEGYKFMFLHKEERLEVRTTTWKQHHNRICALLQYLQKP